jgi:hypothetical protein
MKVLKIPQNRKKQRLRSIKHLSSLMFSSRCLPRRKRRMSSLPLKAYSLLLKRLQTRAKTTKALATERGCIGASAAKMEVSTWAAKRT